MFIVVKSKFYQLCTFRAEAERLGDRNPIRIFLFSLTCCILSKNKFCVKMRQFKFQADFTCISGESDSLFHRVIHSFCE